MPAVAASLIPVFLLLVTGWATRVTRVVDEAQWAGFERVTYFILFPALVIETLARTDLRSAPLAPIGGSLVAGILLVTGLLLALRRPLKALWGLDGPAFTSVLQGATRWNTFVALAIAANLYGQQGTSLGAIAIASMIPLLNVIAVLVLARYASPRRLAWRDLVGALAKNPFIWSCAVVLFLNILRPPIPAALMSYTEILGRASLAAGLLVVGAGRDLSRLRRPSLALALSTTLKLALLPLVASTIAKGLGVSGAGLAVTVICSAVPTASGSYILARQMGGDASLMAEILTVQTLLALLTLPVALALLT